MKPLSVIKSKYPYWVVTKDPNNTEGFAYMVKQTFMSPVKGYFHSNVILQEGDIVRLVEYLSNKADHYKVVLTGELGGKYYVLLKLLPEGETFEETRVKAFSYYFGSF